MTTRTMLMSLALTGLLVLGCSEKTAKFPWVEDLDASVEADGKLIGYEFWAKW